MKFPQHVSIVCPPAHKAITIFKFGHLHVLLKEDGVLRRASAALQGIIPATRVDQIPQGLIALRTTAMLYRFTFTHG